MKITEIQLNQEVKLPIYCGYNVPETRPVRVKYIHPEKRFIMIEYKTPKGHISECIPVNRTTGNIG